MNGLTDRNAAIRKHYASTIGHLVSTAKESSLEKLFAKIRHWYFEREGRIFLCFIGPSGALIVIKTFWLTEKYFVDFNKIKYYLAKSVFYFKGDLDLVTF